MSTAIPALIALRNPVMQYDWGSHDALAALRGEPRTDHPEAELWIGAHPKAPSVALLADGEHPVDAFLQEHAADLLGDRCAQEFQGRLPFLFKLLAVAKPLSIQLHPNSEQALAGWEREEAEGVAVGDPTRTFVDRFAKPELFAALVPSIVLYGFRPAPAVLADLRAVGLGAIEQQAQSSASGELFLQWLRHATPELLDSAATALAAGITDDARRALVERLLTMHPGDPAALAPLFMNMVHLEPGAALPVEAGIVHAAMEGFGVEVMAASDNVVRTGLTSKHRAMDVFAELADLEAHEPVVLTAAPEASGWSRFATSHPEFELTSASVGETPLPVSGFAALLCVEGTATVTSGDAVLTLTPTDACFLRAGCDATITGHARVFACRVPLTSDRP